MLRISNYEKALFKVGSITVHVLPDLHMNGAQKEEKMNILNCVSAAHLHEHGLTIKVIKT